jgi:peptidoglycan/LPS O-acetylase OafA/YrhL
MLVDPPAGEQRSDSGDQPAVEAKVVSGAEKTRRLRGVDGLRAFACLWVVLFHIRAAAGGHVTRFAPIDLFVRSGSTGVSLFLVISGFSLYIPYANGRESRFRTGSFLWRRCRRLLPAYYVSLGLIVLVIALAGTHAGFASVTGLGLLKQTLEHIALVHQLFPNGFYALNGAYWSLGLEWELYLTLPLLIYGVRRIGLMNTLWIVIGVNVAYRLGLALFISLKVVAPHTALATDVLPNLFIGRWGEFALGMVAAELYVTGRLRESWMKPMRYAVVAVVPIALLTVGNPLNHLLFGFVFFTLLCVVLDGDNFIARIASLPPLVVLGTMSYSIYLVHQPILQSSAYFLRKHGVSQQHVLVALILLIPAVLAAAWVLFVTVERTTVNRASFADMTGASILLLGPEPKHRQD